MSNKKVKLARIELDLTQKDLADIVGTSNVTIVKIEKGDYDSVKLGTLKAIANVLNSSVQELFLNDSVAAAEK